MLTMTNLALAVFTHPVQALLMAVLIRHLVLAHATAWKRSSVVARSARAFSG